MSLENPKVPSLENCNRPPRTQTARRQNCRPLHAILSPDEPGTPPLVKLHVFRRLKGDQLSREKHRNPTVTTLVPLITT